MFDSHRRRRLLASSLLALAGAGAIWLVGRPIPVRGQAAPRLSTVLADLAASVTQDGSLAAGESVAAAPGLPRTLPKSVQDAMRGRHLRVDQASGVQVYILLSDWSDDILSGLQAAGITIEIADRASRRVQARVPASRLQAVSTLPFVTFIRTPAYAIRHAGSVTTEGDAILHSDQVRGQLHVDGTGVRVGVVSDGLKGIFATGCTTCGGASGGPIASGDLPDATATRTAAGVLTSASGGITGRSFQSNSDLEGLPPASPPCAFAGAGAEGTALLEVVHDVAPGAKLSFANADTDLAFNQAVNFLAANNEVVVDDLGFYGEPSDGTSTVSSNTAAALNNPANAIRAYVTAVGNSADEHYFGAYADSGVDGTTVSGITTAGHLHLFQRTGDTTDVLGLGAQPYNLITMPTNGEAAVFLTWNDPTGGSGNNYDLYLVRQSTGAVVARSTDAQSGSGDPVEILDYVNTGAGDAFRILVQNVGDRAAGRNLNLFSFSPECAVDGPRPLDPSHHDRHNYNTATRSIAAQGDAGGSPVSVISVGAICSASAAAAGVFQGASVPDESCNDTSNSTIEFFSSLGPTLDGRTKPDISAIDGVSVSGAGRFPRPFFGTSAAAPHVAGIAALALQAAPCLAGTGSGALGPADGRSRLRNLLLNNADHLGGVPNNTFGFGRVDALAAVQQTTPSFTGGSSVTVSGNTPAGASISGGQLGFTDPDACPLTTLTWTGGCGSSPGPSLNCPFGTSDVKVSASNNGLAFSPVHDVRVTVTSFTMSVAPTGVTVAGGNAATYTVTATAQGGTFAGPVTLACANLPAQSTCTFNPAAISPGGGSAQSTLTISTGVRATSTPVPGGGSGGQMRVTPLVPIALAALALVVAAMRTRRRVVAAGLAAAIGALVIVQACGGSSGSSSGGNNGGGGAAGSVTVSPAALTYAAQSIRVTSAPQSVTLANGTSSALAIASIAATGDFAQTNNCGTSLGAAANCVISVTFTPTAAGSRTGAVVVTDSGAGSPRSVTLAGTGQGGTTPAGTYSIGVTGASGSLVQNGSVTLTVQ